MIDTNLSYGARGTAVTELQNMLISKGFLNTQASGNFYSLTRQAVIAYQTYLGLPATGFVGPMTRSKINSELTSQSTPLSTSAQTDSVASSPATSATVKPMSGSINQTLDSTAAAPSSSSISTYVSPTLSPELKAKLDAEAQVLAQENAKNGVVATTPTSSTSQSRTLTPAEQMAVNNSLQAMRNSCGVEHPTLTFQADRGVSTANATFLVVYNTTCLIDKNMTWSFSDGNGADTKSGTLGDGNWRFGNSNGSGFDNVAFYSFSGAYPGITNFTFTVGTTTAVANTYK
jgi:peptidoglycan hydrolase-like protein with peptidoglycan-binding domain